MKYFKAPKWVNDLNFTYTDYRNLPIELLDDIKQGLSRFNENDPLISIVIPAWNEEYNLLRTLASLSRLNLPFKTELIVVNNNSTDKTQEILDYFGVRSFFQPIQGISVTRQLGLEHAKGTYIFSADADSIYPPNWGINYLKLLENSKVSVVYGRYSFIPSNGNRFPLVIHEFFAELIFNLRRNKKDCINVMGFNSAFKKEQALAIGGYSKVCMKWEDGMMAKRLSESFGTIVLESSLDSRPWTSDRRLLEDGSLFKAFVRRVKKELSYIHQLIPFLKWEMKVNQPQK